MSFHQFEPALGGVSRGNRQRRRATWPVRTRRQWEQEESFPLQQRAGKPDTAATFNHADPSARPVADRHQVRSMIARGRNTSSRVLMLIPDVLNRFCTAHPFSQQLNNGIAFWNIGPQPNTNAGSQDPLYGRDNGCRNSRHLCSRPPSSMIVGLN